MNPHLQRGLLLFEQQRHEQAEAEFRQAVLADPQDAYTRAMLALAVSSRERHHEAEEIAGEALKLDPGHPFVHYARAHVLADRNDPRRALESIREAVQLDPENADFRALEAQIHMNLRRWNEALNAAEAGLALDAEHVPCANLRAMALVKLGRKDEAGQTIDSALARNPEDPITHANQGWTLLHAGQSERALEHFREALRLDPGNEWARQGIVEALKARYLVYSLLLKYFLWMSRLSAQMQWVVILGGLFGMRALRAFSKSNPEFAPYVLPIQILYIVFVFLTWTAEPLFNLLLRLNRFGRLALSREEIFASNCVGALTGLALLSLLAATVNGAFLWLAAVLGFSILPLSAVFKCPAGWPKFTMTAYTAVVMGAGLAAFFVPFLAGFRMISGEEMKNITGVLMGVFAIGIVLSGWVANFLIMQRVRK
jgi:tetratricopeptide (TPR) repeat protein